MSTRTTAAAGHDEVRGAAPRPARISRLARRRVRAAWLFLAPMLAVLAAVAAWPLLRTVWFSFTDADLADLDAAAYVGFENFVFLVRDPDWWNAVWNTTVFAVISVTLETVLGLIVALALNARFGGRGLLRAAVLIPWAIPTVVSAQMWAWMLNDVFGVVNAVLRAIGVVDEPVAWLASPDTALAAVIAVDVWKTTPFMALLILAGLQMLPHECYEQARVDGVHPVRVFFRITLPLVKPALMVAIIFRALDALRIFDLIYVMTGNNRDTMSMSVYARQQLVDFQDVGYGSAASTLLFLLIALFTLVYLAAGRIEDEEGREGGGTPAGRGPGLLIPLAAALGLAYGVYRFAAAVLGLLAGAASAPAAVAPGMADLVLGAGLSAGAAYVFRARTWAKVLLLTAAALFFYRSLLIGARLEFLVNIGYFLFAYVVLSAPRAEAYFRAGAARGAAAGGGLRLELPTGLGLGRAARRRVGRAGFYLLLAAIILYTVFPFYWAIVSSLKSGSELFDVELIPTDPDWRNYVAVFREQPFGRNILNSVFVAVSTVLLSLALAVAAAYALGRIRFRGRTTLLFVILGVSMFPQIAVLSGMFELIRVLGLYNNLLALTLSYMIFTLPFTVWVLTTFMRELPKELEEAAIMDGAKPLTIVTRVFLPLMGPALATTGLLAFIAAWNEFLFALTFTLTSEMRTVPVAIALMSGASAYELPWGNIMAASVIVTVPLIVLVLIFQRRIVSGLTAGAVKG